MMAKEGAANSAYNILRDDLFCKYCGKQCKNLNSLKNHQCRCKENPEKIHCGANKGMIPWNKGLTINDSESVLRQVRKSAQTRCRKKTSLEIELDDDGKLRDRWRSKYYNDLHHENYGFDLTFDQFCLLVKEAGIKSSQMGMLPGGTGYVLARYNDEGSYTWGNCRFITQLDNLNERKVSNSMIEAGKRVSEFSRSKWNRLKENDPEGYELKRKDIGDKISKSLSKNPKIIESRRKREEERSKMKEWCKGERNSQYGTFWITNGVINKKWRKEKGDIPEGFHKGRAAI